MLVLIKLVLHPLVALLLLTCVRAVRSELGQGRGADGGAAAGAQRVRAGAAIRFWVEPASGSVLLGTLVSVATLTTVMWLVQHGVV